MNSTVFLQTQQIATSVNPSKLAKHREVYEAHAKVLKEANATGDDLIKKVEILLKAARALVGPGALDSTSTLGGKLNLSNLDLWLPQAKQDPSFSRDILRDWADALETHLKHSMHFDDASLLGNIFNEWLASGDDPSTTIFNDPSDEGSTSISSGGLADAESKELHDQNVRLMSTIFDEKPIDTDALKLYLSNLFSGEEAAKELRSMREDLTSFGNLLERTTITAGDAVIVIYGLIVSGLMDERKMATLFGSFNNDTVVNELTSVLNMRMASLNTWSWPAEGIFIEMRRHLNGKYRAFADLEDVDALLLQYIGVAWQVRLKSRFQCIFENKAWLSTFDTISPTKAEILTSQIGVGRPTGGIEGYRQMLRQSNFLFSQLFSSANSSTWPPTYDDLFDPAATDKDAPSPAVIKQKLLQIMATECGLNRTLHGTHTVIRSDLEWFGPSLPHRSILTILEFIGVPEQWLVFFEKFLSTPVRFSQDPASEVRICKRGTPISYAMSMMCGEVVLFGMDFAVNQKAKGLFLYRMRMHDDLWLWDASVDKCATGWREMNVYANLVGLTFNQSKTGSAYVGTDGPPLGLPNGDIRWGFLRFDQKEARFVIDQKVVDLHIAEFRRQLEATKSVSGWVNTHNKYMAYFYRNFGGRPVVCFGEDHSADMIQTLTRIQCELLPGIEGGAVGYLRSLIEQRFGIRNLSQKYFYTPIIHGGLALRKPIIEDFVSEKSSPSTEGKPGFEGTEEEDVTKYKLCKEEWEKKSSESKIEQHGFDQFMSFEEYISYRETWHPHWLDCYKRMLSVPSHPELKPYRPRQALGLFQ